MLQEIEKITKIKNIYTIEDRRKGDVDLLVCSNSKAKKLLNWQPKNSAIKKIIKDETIVKIFFDIINYLCLKFI